MLRETEREAIKATALEEINKGRAVLRLEPLHLLPMGQPRSMCGCVVARALERECSDELVITNSLEEARMLADRWNTQTEVRNFDPGGQAGARLPAPVRRFLRMFDHGEFVELIESAF